MAESKVPEVIIDPDDEPLGFNVAQSVHASRASRPLALPPPGGNEFGKGLRIDVRRTGNRVSITEAIQIGGDTDREPPFEQRVTGIVIPQSGARERAMQMIV